MKYQPAYKQAMRYLWAFPYSLIGFFLASILWGFGGKIKRYQGVLRATAPLQLQCLGFPAGAITLGHVVIGQCDAVLNCLWTHELEHVRQYEVWGIFFLPAYLVSGLVQIVKGRNPYWFNYFEIQARERAK